jgi:hypothetical protein
VCFVYAIIVLSILTKNMYASFHFKGLKLIFGIKERLLASEELLCC